ncbi:MAG: M20 family metallo-hydrolase [Spirochaetaceae bacterium]|jgi:succinyl-diaminopimelate desuccinylase|nr:M20 family metallo-hydrolase [Spirochaetaceae bacterium]
MQEKIFSYIDKAEVLAVELETELCKRPAIAPQSGGEGELEKAEYLESWLTFQGFTFERINIADGRAKNGLRPNIVVPLDPPADSGGRCFWIMSHLDVVPPGARTLWHSDPWTVVRKDDGPLGPRLIGRGVEDNQQGLVASLIAAMALKQGGIRPPLPVKLLFCADEECGSAYGIAELVKRPGLFGQDDLVLIPDGGDSKGETIEIAEKNLLWIEFTTRGKQAHGSRPDLGNNAHLAGAELLLHLHYELSEKFNGRDPLFEPDYSTIQPTKKTANVPNINTIPGEDYFCMDMRLLPQYPLQTVLAEVDRIKGEVEAKHGVSIGYTASQQVESKSTPADSPLVAMLSKAVAKVYGVQCRPIGIGGGTVGSFLRNRGIHCAVWSRMDDTAHQPNEYARIANILGDAKVMALLMLEGQSGGSSY